MLSLRESEGDFKERQHRGRWEVTFAVSLSTLIALCLWHFPSSLCPLTIFVFFLFYLQVRMLLNSGKTV